MQNNYSFPHEKFRITETEKDWNQTMLFSKFESTRTLLEIWWTNNQS